MLVGDRGQPGQAHQVFVTGVRIVHPRVASVGGQVLHRLQQCSAVCVGDRLGHHIIGPQRSNQRDALGCAKGQIKPMLSALTERSPMRTVGAIPSSSQRATTCASASPPTRYRSTRPRRRLRGCRLRAAMLGCGFRVRSSTPPSRHLRARSHAAYSAAWAVSM
jgi:hypothetical protein